MKYFLYILFLFSLFSFGQNQKKIDSLKRILKNTNEQTKKLKLTKNIFDLFIGSNLDSANIYRKKYEKIAKQTKNKSQIVKSYLLSSSYFYNKSNIDSALNLVNKSILITKNEKNDSLKANLYLKLSTLYERNMDYDKSEKYAKLGLKYANLTNNEELKVHAYISLGNLFSRKNNYNNALDFYFKIDSIYKKSNTENFGLALAYENISLIYIDLHNDLAITYINKAEKIYTKIKDDFGIYFSYLLKGRYYQEIGKFKDAVYNFEKSRQFFSKFGDAYYLNEIYISLGNSLSKIGKFKKATLMFEKAKVLLKNSKDKRSILELYYKLGQFYTNTKKHRLSIIYLNKADSINNTNSKGFSLAYKEQIIQAKSNAYASRGNYKLAYKFKDEFMKINDSLKKLENIKSLQELETKYQTQKKEQKIALLTAKNKLNLAQKKNQRNLFIGGLAITTLLGLFFFFQYHNRKKVNKKLRELDTAKSNFFVNISHEFRTPLTLISGPIQKQLKKENLPKEERSNLLMMQRNSNRLLFLVDQLLDISKLESGSLKLKISKVNITPFIGNLIDGFSFKAKQKNIDLVVNTKNLNSNAWIDKDAIEKMATNLLSNAVKYTLEKGTIVCNTFIKDDKLVFEIKNSGKGLTEKELKKVFKRFYQIDNDTEGVGIGLALVKELVTLHKGNITVDSELNEWTTFKIVLPINKASFKEDEIVLKISDLEQNFINKEDTSIIENNKPTDLNSENPILLIVEDNIDVLTYVSSIFSETHSIIQAKNGQEGIDLAIEHIPDIIISDIMMPIKDGIALCNTLKVDERTSHIPIILLTAKAGEENEIKGVKTGADDYILKPFNEDILTLKVEKLIEIRKKLQERYSQEVILRPKDITINTIDEDFLNRVQLILDENLIESSFNIENFSKSAGMSRMQLHRKLKALTGLSASEFIRSQRLKLAAKLLEKSDINVSQIGYSIGFNNHAYFSKCFKEMYNCTPSEYAKSKN